MKGGGYELSYTAKGVPNVEVHAVGVDGREVRLSRTLFGAQPVEKLDLHAPASAQPQASEFVRLTQAVSPHLSGNASNLKDAVERDGRQDFSALAGSTGWDGRLLALAAEAFSNQSATGMPADGLYALSRTGLPTNPTALAAVSLTTVAKAMEMASAAGIVDASAVKKTLDAFTEFAPSHRLSRRLQGSRATANDFLARARISASDRDLLVKLLKQGSSGNLLAAAKAAGLSESGFSELKAQGQLAYLTFNNLDLCEHLSSLVGTEPRKLLGLGFYDASKWVSSLKSLAGDDESRLADLVPESFKGPTFTARLDAYTQELARRVRLIDGHAVTVHRIQAGAIEGVPEQAAVAKFLEKSTPLGFRLGGTPVSKFIADHPSVLAESVKLISDHSGALMPSEKAAKVSGAVRALSSIYSVCPDDDALAALLRAGVTSALWLSQFTAETLVETIEPKLAGSSIKIDVQTARTVVWRARQKSATVFNVFSGLKSLRTAGALPRALSTGTVVASTHEQLKGLFPTLENLFGTVDYCECEHCRSVLSPAAYLVDILRFLDPDIDAWATQKASYWKRVGTEYGKQKPFDALDERRPDLKGIALTCENTNTALPYIDIVNEVLEQVAALELGVLSDRTEVHPYDTGEASSQDLIAEPTNLVWETYVGVEPKDGLDRKKGLDRLWFL